MRKREWFRHLTDKDRDRIQALRDDWRSQAAIAEILGFSRSAISRELRRDPARMGRHVADRAATRAGEKRRHSKYPGMKVEENPELRQYLVRALQKLRSPGEIAGRMRREGIRPAVGKNAIYRWLYSADGHPYCRHLCTERTGRRRQRRLAKRVLIPNRIPLHERPNAPGLIHAERDLFVPPTRLRSRGTGLLIAVPTAKLLAGSILPNRESITAMTSAKSRFHRIRAGACTADSGIENVAHAASGAPAYFCDPGAPRQKPNVERGIGLVRRRFLPKSTDLARVPDTVFQSQLRLLNGKYRKSLGYRSACEVALERGIISKIPRISLTPAVAFR